MVVGSSCDSLSLSRKKLCFDGSLEVSQGEGENPLQPFAVVFLEPLFAQIHEMTFCVLFIQMMKEFHFDMT